MAILYDEQQRGLYGHFVEQYSDVRCGFFVCDDVVQAFGAGKLFGRLDGCCGKQRAASDGERRYAVREPDGCGGDRGGPKRHRAI